MSKKVLSAFERSVMNGIHIPIAKTETMNPDKPVQFFCEYRAKAYHYTGKPLYDNINTIVVRLSTPIAPEPGNKIAVSKRTVKQSGHWCFPSNREKPSNLAYSLWGRKEH